MQALKLLCGIAAGAFLIVAAVVMLAPVRAFAAHACPPGWNTIAADVALARASGWTVLGLAHIPHTEGYAMFYRAGAITRASPVVDGCVAPVAIEVGAWAQEPGA